VLVRPVSTVLGLAQWRAANPGRSLDRGCGANFRQPASRDPVGWSVVPASAPFELAAKGDEKEILFHIQPVRPGQPQSVARSVLHLVAEVGGGRFTLGQTRIEHDHIPIETMLAHADVSW